MPGGGSRVQGLDSGASPSPITDFSTVCRSLVNSKYIRRRYLKSALAMALAMARRTRGSRPAGETRDPRGARSPPILRQGGHRNCPESCDGCENGAGRRFDAFGLGFAPQDPRVCAGINPVVLHGPGRYRDDRQQKPWRKGRWPLIRSVAAPPPIPSSSFSTGST